MHELPLDLVAATGPLPNPAAVFTIPVIVVLGGLALFWVARKLVTLALIAAIIAAVVLAYQAGAFDHYVGNGKQTVNNHP